MRKLEAMLLCADRDNLLLVSGTGEVIEPDDGVIGHRQRRQFRPGRRPRAV